MTEQTRQRGPNPLLARTMAGIGEILEPWRDAGERIALVPTMGALHEGHLSLVRLAQNHASRVVVSVFVNPTQFGPDEDFDTYRRQEEVDARLLGEAGVDAMFVPTVSEMYPDGLATPIRVSGVTEGLCADYRPGHFDGVTTVVSRLFALCQPDLAVFGEKDYQQLLVIRRLVADLNLTVEIVPGPTVREPDGLALSSRNAQLTPEQRHVAGRLPQILSDAAQRLPLGQAPVERVLAEGIKTLLAAGFDAVDYLALRDAETLEAVTRVTRPARVLAAVHVGEVRLIDNMEVLPPSLGGKT